MPNWKNIRGPITLIGNGRSGTSLVSQIFSHHPDGAYIGETANLIHTVYHALDNSLPLDKKNEIKGTIRGSFNYLYPSKEEFWFHKPIGIPMASNYFSDREAFRQWYWTIFDEVFPDAEYFTVLRNPLDVIASSREWWGRDYAGIINSINEVANIVLHPMSKVGYAVSYDELIRKKKTKTKELFKYLGVPFHENCMKAFERGYVMSKNASENEEILKKKQNKAFKRIEQYADIPEELLTDQFKETINQCYDKFGLETPSWDIKALIEEHQDKIEASSATPKAKAKEDKAKSSEADNEEKDAKKE